MAKLFITFLDNSELPKCYYKLYNQNYGPVFHPSPAIYKLNYSSYSVEDRSLILIDSSANAQDTENLKREFYENLLPVPVQILLPETYSEENIWNVFQNIVDKVKEDDELIVDITGIPNLLAFVITILIQYLKIVKNIKLVGVYYACFGEIGKVEQIKNLPADQRIVPVYEFKSFLSLYDWALAVNNFIKFGRSDTLENLTESDVKTVLKDKGEATQSTNALNNLISTINKHSLDVLTCRGNEIIDLDYTRRIFENVDKVEENVVPAMQPIIEKIKYEFKAYRNSDLYNGFNSVKWCIDHDLIQQGITILQETVITLLLKEWQIPGRDSEIRNFVTEVLEVKARNTPEKEWDQVLYSRKAFAERLLSKISKEFADTFDKLTECREDINRNAFTKNIDASELKKELNKAFQTFQRLI